MIATTPTTEHTAAQVRLDKITEWIEAHGCAHSIFGINTWPGWKPEIRFRSIADMARVFDGSGIAVSLHTVGGGRHARCEADGFVFSACDPLPDGEREILTL